MTKQTEALKLALEKVQEFKVRWWKVPPFGNRVNKATREAITNAHSPIFELENAIREALAEQPAQQQEPVAVVTGTYGGRFTVKPLNPAMVLPLNMALYHRPQPAAPQRSEDEKQWVGLTPEEIDAVYRDMPPPVQHWQLARAIEAKLREKNA